MLFEFREGSGWWWLNRSGKALWMRWNLSGFFKGWGCFLWNIVSFWIPVCQVKKKKKVVPVSLNYNCLFNYLWALDRESIFTCFPHCFWQSSVVNSFAHFIVHTKEKWASLLTFSLRLPGPLPTFKIVFALSKICPSFTPTESSN